MRAFRAARSLAIPFLVYTFAAIFITWPLLTQLSTHAIGAGYGDEFENIRLIWWQQYALQHGLNPFYQSLLGYPDGFFSATQIAEPLTYWLATPLSFITGAVTAFNLIVFFGLILNGLSAYILCRALLNSPSLSRRRHAPETQPERGLGGEANNRAVGETNLPALLGGLIFMAFPTLQGHLSAGHSNVLALYGLPIYALCLWQILNTHTTRRTLIIGALSFALTALGSVGQIVYTLFPITFFFLLYYTLFNRRALFRRLIIRSLALLFIGAALLLIPFYIPLFTQLSGSERPADLQEIGWVGYSTDPLGFVSPSPFTPWGAHLAPAYTRTILGVNSAEGSAYLGIIALIFAAIAIGHLTLKHQAQRTKSAKVDLDRSESSAGLPSPSGEGLGVRAGLFLFTALGSMLFSLGPLLKWLDAPAVYTLGDQYQSYIVLPWAIFQSLPIFNATRTPGRFNIVTGLALAVLAAYGLRHLLSRLTRQHIRLALTATLMLVILGEYQLFFPALTTPATIPPIFYELAQRTDIRAVFDIPWDNPLVAKEALYYQTAHQKPLIAGHVTRKTPVDPAKLNVLEAAATSQLINDWDYAGFALDENSVDIVVLHKAYFTGRYDGKRLGDLGSAIYQDEQIAVFKPEYQHNLNRPYVLQIRKSDLDYLFTSQDSYLGLQFPCTLLTGSDCHDFAHALDIDGKRVSALGEEGDRIWIKLTHGFHTARTSGPSYVALQLAEQKPLDKPIQLGNTLSLMGAQFDQYRVNTTWHADQKLPGDYHIFVHLLDKDGKLVAQYDNQPGGGIYPTTRWSANQDWAESISLPTKGLPPGNYELYTGWYSYPDMQRLPVYADTPHAKDGLIYLGRITIPSP